MKRGQIQVEQLFVVILLLVLIFMIGLYAQHYNQEKETLVQATANYPTIDKALTDYALQISPSVQDLKLVSAEQRSLL